ncbi:unnamed protein product [Protopolystoma xenopodis]|uniref:Uncharacterized protein n=1 Tax=Protopolystoma xenopodis TaxID=117903 RepID=A0A448WRN7_9PLAT|nr:unnamed protein product [Protopolystoma xenopodis]
MINVPTNQVVESTDLQERDPNDARSEAGQPICGSPPAASSEIDGNGGPNDLGPPDAGAHMQLLAGLPEAFRTRIAFVQLHATDVELDDAIVGCKSARLACDAYLKA